MEETPLPLKSPKIILKPEKLKYLIITPPKWGKTTFFSGCPNACLLAFEAGYASAECPVIVVTHWDRPYKEKKDGWGEDDQGVVYASAMEIIEELERYNPYDFIIIDTMDMAVKLCADYYCNLAKVDHPSQGGDYGRGFDLLQTGPIRKFYNRITKLGVGVAAITHCKERVEKDRFEKDRFRRETSLPGGVQQFVHAQSDVIMHGFFARRRKGQKDRDRYISFDGTDEVMAGTRVRRVYLPNKYIVSPPTRNDLTLPWQQWFSFFKDNPAAGQQAEKDFIRLFEGLDDETVRKQENKNTKNDQEKTNTTESNNKARPGKSSDKASEAAAGSRRGR
jgi:hypothetical protein